MFQSGMVSIIHRPLDGLLDIIAMGIPESFYARLGSPLISEIRHWRFSHYLKNSPLSQISVVLPQVPGGILEGWAQVGLPHYAGSEGKATSC